MPREQRPTIKANHCIEIWSPVNFHMLRNKTLVYQEENSRWRSLGFSDFVSFVILLKQMNDMFCFPQELLRILKKKKQTWLQSLWDLLFICQCGLLTHSVQHCCKEQADHYWQTTGATDKRVCWNYTAETRWGCFVVKEMYTKQI